MMLIIIAPFFLALGGWLTSLISNQMAMGHRYVKLAHLVEQEDLQIAKGMKNIIEDERTEAFRQHPQFVGPKPTDSFKITGKNYQERRANLFKYASDLRHSFYIGSWALGIWVALVIIVKLIKLSIKRTRLEYEADRGSCYACGRCYEFCPGSNGVPVQAETGSHIRE